jgi:transmembrane sensor
MNEARFDAERDPVYAAAAEWLARLRESNLTLEETCAWQQWMGQDARHRRAFKELEDVWEMFGSVAQPEPASAHEIRMDTYDGSVPVGDWISSHSKAPRPASLRAAPRCATPRRPLPHRYAFAATLVIALTCVGVGSLFAPSLVSNSRGVDYTTTVGENAHVLLADGSGVQLGGHTRIRVTLSAHVRQIDLLAGEACFEVAKDPTRPFLVRAGTANVTAVGTEFNVRRSGDRVVVSVLEGRVLVQSMAPVIPIAWIQPSVAVGAAAPLKAGQRTTFNRRGLESTQAVSDSSSVVAWQHGRLAFEAEPLRYVIQDVNRYATKPIVLADERTGDIRVTGTVTEANIVGWINSLQTAFGIRSEIDADRIILRPD